MQSSPAAQTRHAPPSWPQFWKVFPGKQTLGFPGSLPQQPDLLAAQFRESQTHSPSRQIPPIGWQIESLQRQLLKRHNPPAPLYALVWQTRSGQSAGTL
jgi:hypothetical protein